MRDTTGIAVSLFVFPLLCFAACLFIPGIPATIMGYWGLAIALYFLVLPAILYLSNRY